jgi:hypothetical protein
VRSQPIERIVHLWQITVAHGRSRVPFNALDRALNRIIAAQNRRIAIYAAASEAKGRQFESAMAREITVVRSGLR